MLTALRRGAPFVASAAALATAFAAALSVLASPLAAQAEIGSFIFRLGSDTVALESYTRSGTRIEGTIVRRLPQTSLLRYILTLNADNSVAQYEQSTLRPDGTPVPNAPAGLGMTFTGDSVIRNTVQNGQPVTLRAAAPKGTIPNVAFSAVQFALAVETARRVGEVNVIGFGAQQAAPTKLDLRLIGPDSAEIVQAGFRTGLRLDARGRVTRSDGSLTTQKFIGMSATGIDARAIATAWAAFEGSTGTAGPASTRDTVRAMVGTASIWIDYGRPAKRGRQIWGQLVPFDTTWRLGANSATQFRTDKALEINGVTVPAGFYTLWLYPSKGQTLLIVNTQTGQWGTAYDASKDLVKIPLETRSNLPTTEERFRISIEGDVLLLHWDRAGYSAKLRAK